jgi:hypothetical protein
MEEQRREQALTNNRRSTEHGLPGLDYPPQSGKLPQVPEVSQLGLSSCLLWCRWSSIKE